MKLKISQITLYLLTAIIFCVILFEIFEITVIIQKFIYVKNHAHEYSKITLWKCQ
jgi:hypothetical protein